MPERSLGLFDTPPGRDEIRFGIAIVGLLFAAFLAVLPFRDVRLGEVSSFVPTIDALMFVGDVITATLLYAQGKIFRSRALLVLATGYLFAALLLIAHALTFPGAFARDGLLDAGINTTGWISTFQRGAFPVAIMLYVLLRRTEAAPRLDRERSPAEVVGWVLLAIGLAAAVTALTTRGHALLPAFYANRSQLIYSHAVAYQAVTFALLFVATTMLFRKLSSVLDLWLLVALAGWLIQSTLIMTLHGRFTVGFYCLYGILLASHLVVMIALVAESNRLYARLASSTAARDMEREARLMSMDAVAAAISHEVGQPIAAISLNASAGLRWLTGPRPRIEKAIASLRSINDSTQRSFEVIKSVRAIFAKEPDWGIEFSLNDMIRETAALLDRELADAKVSLRLSLDEELPALVANRVQLQQVLVNLIKNAIESCVLTRTRKHSIAICSRLDGEKMVLEVSDDGIGIPPEDAPHIFDAFHTTKSTGTGIGLSLCRTIVEEHGGRIWASHGHKHGATFYVQFPRAGSIPMASNQ